MIDDAFCKELVRLGNITFLLSIEGTPETNDARRGAGHFEAVMKAMDLLKKYGIVFGTSICYTKYNVEAVTSDEFFKMITDKGARFGFYFHYMPVGNNAVTDLLPTIQQRKYMIIVLDISVLMNVILISIQWISRMMVSSLVAV